jgi:hypothetical protein
MAVSAADIAEVLALEGAVPETNTLDALTTIPALLAYIATWSASEGRDPADDIELLARLAELPPDMVRSAAVTLKAMGYYDVGDRLREIAGKRTHDLRPIR